MRTAEQTHVRPAQQMRPARTAGMHTVLTILHAVLRHHTPWQPTLLAT